MIRAHTIIVVLFLSSFAFAQEHAVPCCNCESGSGSAEAVCMAADPIRKHVDHIEPLRPSGLDKNLNLTGLLVVEVRFGTDGKVECTRVVSGNPIATAPAMQALPKWTFKPLVSGGAPQRGCGQLTIHYHLSDKGSSTKLQK
jgi:hypothetical protein